MRANVSRNDPASPLVRPIIEKLHGYVPGEQPKIEGLIKLNTNENPFGPAPSVLAALSGALDGRLRLYPNPTAEPLRAKLAQFHQCAPENIIVGNGSDELLALATRAFVEPLAGLTHYALDAAVTKNRVSLAGLGPGRTDVPAAVVPGRYTVQYFEPSYSLYPVLAAIHGARPKGVALGKDFAMPSLAELQERNWDFNAALTYITTPNAPSGRAFPRACLDEVCNAQRGVIVLDEAYVDFAEEHALDLALRYPHVLVARTFSKAYSLCFLRVGYFVGNAALIAALQKIRDSYNVNGLAQIAAQATLDDLSYYRSNFQRIIASREHVSAELRKLGFEVVPSQTNFILVRPPDPPAELWLSQLRDERILVRWFSQPEIRGFLRVTIGSETEMEHLLKAVRKLVDVNGRSGSPAAP